MRWVTGTLAAGVLLAPVGAPAQTPADVDFGPPAATGTEAAAGFDRRAALLRRKMACENEFKFVSELRRTFDIGKRAGPPPSTWRVPDLVAKAGFVALPEPASGASLFVEDAAGTQPVLPQTCHAVLGENWRVKDAWGPLLRPAVDTATMDGATIVNMVYAQMFGEPDRARRLVSQGPCANPAHLLPGAATPAEQTVVIDLSIECLVWQIRTVIAHPDHGAWKTNANGERVPEFPGTSADKLWCLPQFSFKIDAVAGDWDMAVLNYTRLAYLLNRAAIVQPAVNLDARIALTFLNRNLLTIRSGPDVGATATESYNLLLGCGNFVNEYGDAIDTMTGNGTDPNADSYSKDAQEALGNDDSFWDDLWDFLKVLIVIAAAAAAAAILGFMAGLGALALGAAGGTALLVAMGVGIAIFISAASAEIQETENHLLMQNSARYLKNKLMLAELAQGGHEDAFDDLVDYNETLRVWILERLARIAEEDFIEYNSKPYSGFSHGAILNLLDHACAIHWDFKSAGDPIGAARSCDSKDAAVVDSAAAVFDLSAAKVAVGSLQGRRLIPYRRLAEQNAFYINGRSILEQVAGADSLLGPLQLWTGDVRQTDTGKAREPSLGGLIPYATSKYRPHEVILGIAVEKSVRFDQDYNHFTKERYASGKGWLITAGGRSERQANGADLLLLITIYPNISEDTTNDRGVGVPTTLITRAPGRSRVSDFLRFEGNLEDWGMNSGKPMWSFSGNLCVAGTFACGTSMKFPVNFDRNSCAARVVGTNFYVADSSSCAVFKDDDQDPDNDFFVAIYEGTKGWGFFEVADKPEWQGNIDLYVADLKTRNQNRIEDWAKKEKDEEIEFNSPTLKRYLKFTPDDEDFDAERACGVVNHESGSRFTISRAPAGSGCKSQGPRIFIDLNDPEKPVRKGEDGLSLDPLH